MSINTGILKFYNEKPINPKDVFLKILELKKNLCPNNEWFHFYLSFVDFSKMKLNFNLTNKDFKKEKPYFLSISFNTLTANNDKNKEELDLHMLEHPCQQTF